MSRGYVYRVVCTLALLFASGTALAGQTPVGTVFTYQGELSNGGVPVDEPLNGCDFEFSLWDADVDGSQVGPTLTPTALVADGRFTVALDFGENIFTGNARWLKIAVCCPSPCVDFTTLSPRQELTPAPHALALPGLYTQQNVTSPNLIGGYSGNSVEPGAMGAAIGGGGAAALENRAFDDYATVSGGRNNQAGSDDAVPNTAQFATVGGGFSNTASGYSSTVGGGRSNIASDPYATIGGGANNTASGEKSTVGGGFVNTASGQQSTVGGGEINTASANLATVGGGGGNTASANFASVGGGHVNEASGLWATVGGGRLNITAVGATNATISGGQQNEIVGSFGTIGGGILNDVTDDNGTVGGGRQNQAGDGAGETNDANNATVGGGFGNTASSIGATVGGGRSNTASGIFSTIPGGELNSATGNWSLAAGLHAQATLNGMFVWADGNAFQDFPSATEANFTPAADQFLVRSRGGVVFVTNYVNATGDSTAGVKLTTGAGSWSSLSDRNAKEHVEPVDSRDVLESVAAMPISTWNYKAQEDSIRHMGPMAQDFHEAFGIGGSEKFITTIDADGVALAAIQGLHEIVKEKDSEIQVLQARLGRLEAVVNELATKSSPTHEDEGGAQ